MAKNKIVKLRIPKEKFPPKFEIVMGKGAGDPAYAELIQDGKELRVRIPGFFENEATPLRGAPKAIQASLFDMPGEVKLFRSKNITNTGIIAPGGRAHAYRNLMAQPYWGPKQNRTGGPVPRKLDLIDPESIMRFFRLRSIEYGNWMKSQDRIDYTSGLALALLDLARFLRWSPAQIGLKGRLSIALGARGRSKALAHYEAENPKRIKKGDVTRVVINITKGFRSKLSKGEAAKGKSQILGGGAGALAHEFAHALDNFLMLFTPFMEDSLKGDQLFVSGGRSINIKPRTEYLVKGGVPEFMENVMLSLIYGKLPKYVLGKNMATSHKNKHKKALETAGEKVTAKEWNSKYNDVLFWDTPEGPSTEFPLQPNAWYKKLAQKVKRSDKAGNYWLRRNELFARMFEQYVALGLKAKGYENEFLTTWEESLEWPDEKTIEPCIPNLKKLISMLEKAI